MAVLVCRVAWMPRYRSDDETAVGGGSYVDEGHVPHESLNFLPVGDTYYGFVENRGQQIRLEQLGGGSGDQSVSGVLVVFCAAEPASNEFLVTGWYADATVYRSPIERPTDDLGRRVSFTARHAAPVAESERCFRIPRARDNPPSRIGGVGSRNIWYGLNEERARVFANCWAATSRRPDLTRTPQEAVESEGGACRNGWNGAVPTDSSSESRDTGARRATGLSRRTSRRCGGRASSSTTWCRFTNSRKTKREWFASTTSRCSARPAIGRFTGRSTCPTSQALLRPICAPDFGLGRTWSVRRSVAVDSANVCARLAGSGKVFERRVDRQ